MNQTSEGSSTGGGFTPIKENRTMWMYTPYGDAYWVDVVDDYEGRNAPPLQSKVNAMRSSRTQRPQTRTMVARPAFGMTPAAPAAPVFVGQAQEQSNGINFRNMSVGTIAQLATKILAAITPLPDAPPAASAGASPEDILLDQLEYQRRLAEHAKSNERLRTLGDVFSAVVD